MRAVYTFIPTRLKHTRCHVQQLQMGVLVDRSPKARVRSVKNAHLARSYKTWRDGSTYEAGAELEDGVAGHTSVVV